MKKLVCLILGMLMLSSVVQASEEKNISVEIPVEYTVEGEDFSSSFLLVEDEMKDNSYQSIVKGTLTLKSGEKDSFIVNCTLPGVYAYIIKEADDNQFKSDLEYHVKVYISENDEGTLSSDVLIYEGNSDYKSASAVYRKISGNKSPDETEGSDKKDDKKDNKKNSSAENEEGNPKSSFFDQIKTGDSSPIMLWVGVLVFSLLLMMILINARSKKEKG